MKKTMDMKTKLLLAGFGVTAIVFLILGIKAGAYFYGGSGGPGGYSSGTSQSAMKLTEGVSLYYGVGVPQDYEKATQWFRKAGEQGDAEAQMWLARCYAQGKGVEKNEERYMEWLRKAAEGGHVEAQYTLGMNYIDNRGNVAPDKEEAFKWFDKAAKQGLAEAQYELAHCYSYGIGVKQDKAKAVQWCLKAVLQRHKEASRWLEEYAREQRGK